MKTKKLGKLFAVLLALAITLGTVPFAATPASAATTSDGITYEIADNEVTITDYTGSATELEIPSTIEGYPVTEISHDAFRSCTTLTSITIPEGVTAMGRCAFYGCTRLASISLPESLTSVGDSAFEKTAYYNSSKNWEDNVLYIESFLIEAKSEISGAYTVKEGTRVIASQAFFNCDSITSVTVPEGVVSVCDQAFYGCDNLVSVDLPKGVTSIGERTFNGCRKLASITLPEGLTSIGNYAFNSCVSLASITVPATLTSIDDCAFYNCSSLKKIIILANVISFGDNVFEECSILTIHGRAGSSVEAYATENSIPFIDLDAIPGDLNGDKAINSIDVNVMKRILAGVLSPTYAQTVTGDLDSDGKIGSLDTNMLSRIILGTN